MTESVSMIAILSRLSYLGFLEGRNFRGGEFLRQYLQKRSLFSSIAFHSYHFAKYCISIGSNVLNCVCEKLNILMPICKISKRTRKSQFSELWFV